MDPHITCICKEGKSKLGASGHKERDLAGQVDWSHVTRHVWHMPYFKLRMILFSTIAVVSFEWGDIFFYDYTLFGIWLSQNNVACWSLWCRACATPLCGCDSIGVGLAGSSTDFLFVVLARFQYRVTNCKHGVDMIDVIVCVLPPWSTQSCDPIGGSST